MGGQWSFNEIEGQSYRLGFSEKVGAYDRVLGDLGQRIKEPIDSTNRRYIKANLMIPIDSPEFLAKMELDFENRIIKVTTPPAKVNQEVFSRKQKAMVSVAEFYQGVIESGEMRFGALE